MKDVDVDTVMWTASEPMALTGTLIRNTPSRQTSRHPIEIETSPSTFAFSGRAIQERKEVHLALNKSMVQVSLHLSNAMVTERVGKNQQLETSISAIGLLDKKAIGKLHARDATDSHPYPHRTVTVSVRSLDDDPTADHKNIAFGSVSTGAYLQIAARIEVVTHIAYGLLKRCHCCLRLPLPLFTDNRGLHWTDVGRDEVYQGPFDFEFSPWLNPLSLTEADISDRVITPSNMRPVTTY